MSVTVKMELKQADKYDLFNAVGQKKIGAMYFVKSGQTNKIDPYPQYVSQRTNTKELMEYLKFKQLYVPYQYFDELDLNHN